MRSSAAFVDFGASHATATGFKIEGVENLGYICTNDISLCVLVRLVGLDSDTDIPHVSADT